MIFDMDDILEEVYEQYPEVAESSIKKICGTGLKRIRSLVSALNNFKVRLPSREDYIFFVPTGPSAYNRRTYARQRKKLRDQQNEKTDE